MLLMVCVGNHGILARYSDIIFFLVFYNLKQINNRALLSHLTAKITGVLIVKAPRIARSRTMNY